VKIWLKTQPSENEDHGIRSQPFIENRWGKQWKQRDFILGDQKSLHMVTAAMKLKDTYTFEGKL